MLEDDSREDVLRPRAMGQGPRYPRPFTGTAARPRDSSRPVVITKSRAAIHERGGSSFLKASSYCFST